MLQLFILYHSFFFPAFDFLTLVISLKLPFPRITFEGDVGETLSLIAFFFFFLFFLMSLKELKQLAGHLLNIQSRFFQKLFWC